MKKIETLKTMQKALKAKTDFEALKIAENLSSILQNTILNARLDVLKGMKIKKIIKAELNSLKQKGN